MDFYFTLVRVEHAIRIVVKRVISKIAKGSVMPKVKHYPVGAIYLNKATGNFIIENYAVDPEFDAKISFGSFIRVSAEEMKKNGLAVVMKNLKGFSDRIVTEMSEHSKMANVEERKFSKEHKEMGIHLERDDCLSLWPMDKGKRGEHIGRPEKVISVTLPCTNEEFYNKLMEAFEKC